MVLKDSCLGHERGNSLTCADTLALYHSDLTLWGKRAMTETVVLAKDLPSTFTSEVGRDLSMYTIAFLDAATEPAARRGSGVLVTAGGVPAILTADHVVDLLPKTGRLGLFLTPTNALHSVEAVDVIPVRIARGGKDGEGPDLGAVLLKRSVAGSIAAKKSFFNLDIRRERMLASPPEGEAGLWCANGYLEERCQTATRPDGAVQFIYNFSGFGRPEEPQTSGDHDYFEMPIDYDATEMPESWGGMSGGGLWHLEQLKRRDGDIVASGISLSGILFYQWFGPSGIRSVRAHGRRSVYDVAYRAIIEAAARNAVEPL